MNKKLALLAIAFFLSLASFSQEIVYDSAAQRYQCSEVVKVDSMGRDALFSKVKEWIAINYKSADAVIQLADKDDGKIIVKGNFPITILISQISIRHTIIFDFKDGKFRYNYTDLIYKAPSGPDIHFESNGLTFKKKVFSKTEAWIKNSVASIKEYIATAKTKADNW